MEAALKAAPIDYILFRAGPSRAIQRGVAITDFPKEETFCRSSGSCLLSALSLEKRFKPGNISFSCSNQIDRTQYDPHHIGQKAFSSYPYAAKRASGRKINFGDGPHTVLRTVTQPAESTEIMFSLDSGTGFPYSPIIPERCIFPYIGFYVRWAPVFLPYKIDIFPPQRAVASAEIIRNFQNTQHRDAFGKVCVQSIPEFSRLPISGHGKGCYLPGSVNSLVCPPCHSNRNISSVQDRQGFFKSILNRRSRYILLLLPTAELRPVIGELRGIFQRRYCPLSARNAATEKRTATDRAMESIPSQSRGFILVRPSPPE